MLQHNAGIKNGNFKSEEGILKSYEDDARIIGFCKKVKNPILNRVLCTYLFYFLLSQFCVVFGASFFVFKQRREDVLVSSSCAAGNLFSCLIVVVAMCLLLYDCFLV